MRWVNIHADRADVNRESFSLSLAEGAPYFVNRMGDECRVLVPTRSPLVLVVASRLGHTDHLAKFVPGKSRQESQG